jgi:hypothetical protein
MITKNNIKIYKLILRASLFILENFKDKSILIT